MSIEIKVPSPGESISEVQLASWLVSEGDYVEKDQEIAEIDSDKATLTINASEGGTISLKAKEGDTLKVGEVIAVIDTDAEAPAKESKEKEEGDQEPKDDTSEKKKPKEKEEEEEEVKEEAKDTGTAKKEEKSKAEEKKTSPVKEKKQEKETTGIHISPLAKKLLDENGMSEEQFLDFFRKYRVSKKDVEFFLENKDKTDIETQKASSSWGGSRDTASKKMSMLRLKIAERLVSVKNETAMLTTFNEVNMGAIMDLRSRYKEAFKEKFGVSLGFMSFFTKAVTEAFSHFPMINARLDEDQIVYHNYADIGIAVSTPKGLMVPVMRNAETLSLAEIESSIKELAVKARDNKISIEEMQGGTFTITNGGVFGSMLSTPIINPPQSAILGMHNIVERPIAVNGKVEIHPVMYLALSYDHRIIDGKESVSFLVKVKEMLEDPVRMIYEGEDPATRLLGL